MSLASVLAWLNAHADLVAIALFAIGYLWLNVKNARTAVEKRTSNKAIAAMDRAAILAMKGAASRFTLPGMKSVAESLIPEEADETAPQRPSVMPGREPEPDRGAGGFITFGTLRGIALALVVIAALAPLLSLTGCPMPKPDGCTPASTRCSPSGVPETCSTGERWSHAPPASPCAQRGASVCCWTRSPWGREMYGCALPSACLDEPARDAGAEASDAH